MSGQWTTSSQAESALHETLHDAMCAALARATASQDDTVQNPCVTSGWRSGSGTAVVIKQEDRHPAGYERVSNDYPPMANASGSTLCCPSANSLAILTEAAGCVHRTPAAPPYSLPHVSPGPRRTQAPTPDSGASLRDIGGTVYADGNWLPADCHRRTTVGGSKEADRASRLLYLNIMIRSVAARQNEMIAVMQSPVLSMVLTPADIAQMTSACTDMAYAMKEGLEETQSLLLEGSEAPWVVEQEQPEPAWYPTVFSPRIAPTASAPPTKRLRGACTEAADQWLVPAHALFTPGVR